MGRNEQKSFLRGWDKMGNKANNHYLNNLPSDERNTHKT